MTTENVVLMGPKTLNWILDVMKRQGLSFILLALAIWYLDSQNAAQDVKYEHLNAKYDSCQKELLQTVKDLSISNQQVINENTKVLNMLLRNEKDFQNH